MLNRLVVNCHLVAFEPERVLPFLTSSVKSTYDNRRYLRIAPCNDFVVSSLARQIIEATEISVRFRSYECLRTIKLIIKSESTAPNCLTVETKSQLFRLYQLYIFSSKEEVQWCVSIFLKGSELESKQIQWLITNVDQSVHLLNRFLKYPSANRLIEKWAAQAFAENTYPDRAAEIGGLLIKRSFPQSFANVPPETLLWAAYYSRANIEEKEKMIILAVTPESSQSALDIALRLDLPRVLHHLSQILPEECS